MQKIVDSHILVSVIMPVYNPGIYFRNMLDALHNQSLQRMEVICILDCPTDSSELLLDEYVQIDARFRVIKNEKNKGVGESRNIGLQIAKGEYIGFCDDDDTIISPTYFEELYTAAQQCNADVVMSDVVIDNGKEQKQIRFDRQTTNYVQLQSILFPEYSPMCKNRLARSVWHSVYRRDFIEQNKICFYSRATHLEEDSLFNVQVFTKTNNFVIVPKAYYCWNLSNQRNDANYQSQNDVHTLKVFFDVVCENLSSSDLLSAKQKNTLLRGCLSAHFYQRYCILRDVEMETMLNVFGGSVKYLRLCDLLHVYFESLSIAWKNRTMLVKYALYVLKLKCRYAFTYLYQ